MDRNAKPRYEPTSPLLRKAFAVAAVAATLATAGFIEALANGYGAPEADLAHSAPVVVAQR